MGDYDYLGRLPSANGPDPSTSVIGTVADPAAPAQDNDHGWYNGAAITSGLTSGLNDTNSPVGILTTTQGLRPDGTIGAIFVDPNVGNYGSDQPNGAANVPGGPSTQTAVLAAQKNGPNAPDAVASPNAANSPAAGTNYGSCLPNVGSFVAAHQQDAQTLASELGNGVTPAEVLAVSGNESHYGDLVKGVAKYGNYFGLHGSGPAGTYYSKDNGTPEQKFPIGNGYMSSGQVFVDKESPSMTPGIGDDPLSFFTVLNHHGYATGHPEYPGFMVSTASGNRGPYTLVQACLKGKK